MQMTNLGHAVAHLEYSRFINMRTRLRTNECAYAYLANLVEKLWKVLLYVQILNDSGRLLKWPVLFILEAAQNRTITITFFKFHVSFRSVRLRIWCSWFFMSFPFSLALLLVSWSRRFLCPTWMTWMNWFNTSASCSTSQPLWPASSFCWSCLVRTSTPAA